MSEEPQDINLSERMIPMKGGKEYLPVADRIVWFRRDYPEGTIETTIVSIDEERGSAIFRARITTGKGGVAEATGDETQRDFPAGWVGKAETKAVGRALGYLGFGTASAGFEEGGRVVDAPQAPKPYARPSATVGAPAPPGRAEPAGRLPETLAEVERELAPLERQVGQNDEALSNAEYARYHALNARRKELREPTPTPAPGVAFAPRKPPPKTDAELLAIAGDGKAMLPRREHAAKAYLARATDPFGAEERAAAVRRIEDFDGRDVDAWRDAALGALREKHPAAYAG